MTDRIFIIILVAKDLMVATVRGPSSELVALVATGGG